MCNNEQEGGEEVEAVAANWMPIPRLYICQAF